MLTEKQLWEFRTFGFLILKEVFTPEELETIDREFALVMEAGYRHAPFDGTSRHWMMMLGPEAPFFANLLEDDRLWGLSRQMYGEDAIGVGCDANRYVGNTNWHPDTKSIHQYGVKFAFYLDPVEAESGALRVIPGSHRPDLHQTLRQAREESRLEINGVPAFVCESEPGDVVAFDLRLWHASWGGSNDRRMCTLVYYNNPKTPEEDEATREQGRTNSGTAEQFGRPAEPNLHPEWVANAGGSPTRQRWIERMRELEWADLDGGTDAQLQP